MGLDVGARRVGVALSDESELLARPLKAVVRGAGRAEAAIIDIAVRQKVRLIVVGMPLSETGERGLQCQETEKFCRRLSRRLPLPLEYVDEYLSSQEAHQMLRQSRTKRGRQTKGVVDAIAAAIILQGFLDRQGSLLRSKTK